MPISFFAKWTGLRKVRAAVAAVTEGIRESFAQKRIEEMILKETLMRFQQRGSNPFAQTAPDGTPWTPVQEQTIRRRRSNRNRLQALVDTGTLVLSIRIIESNSDSASALQSAAGARARIGVSPGSPAYGYYKLHQEGGYNKQGRYVPARPFLGVTEATVKGVSKHMLQSIYGRLRAAV